MSSGRFGKSTPIVSSYREGLHSVFKQNPLVFVVSPSRKDAKDLKDVKDYRIFGLGGFRSFTRTFHEFEGILL